MMNHFHFKNNELYAENVRLSDVSAQFGTPCYVYSRAALEERWQQFANAFAGTPHLICYAVKANSNVAILNLLARLDAGFDVVSQGELERVLVAGGDPRKIIFSGVGKQISEILRALEVGIGCINIESAAELERLQLIAAKQKAVIPISLRINPDIDALTHPHISTGLRENKFGIDYEQALTLCQQAHATPYLKLVGIGCHIGSQLTELSPFLQAVDRMLDLVEQLSAADIQLEHLDLGGGLGVRYHQETPPSIQDYVMALRNKVAKYPLKIILEPGRAICADAGILLTRVEYIKQTEHKNFAIVDAGMNDLIRPALYGAYQEICVATPQISAVEKNYDVVGPVCESADFFGKERKLALTTGDLLAIFTAGAYGFSMSSNYNSRPRAAEVLVDGSRMHLVRRRETFADLIELENIIPE